MRPLVLSRGRVITSSDFSDGIEKTNGSCEYALVLPRDLYTGLYVGSQHWVLYVSRCRHAIVTFILLYSVSSWYLMQLNFLENIILKPPNYNSRAYGIRQWHLRCLGGLAVSVFSHEATDPASIHGVPIFLEQPRRRPWVLWTPFLL